MNDEKLEHVDNSQLVSTHNTKIIPNNKEVTPEYIDKNWNKDKKVGRPKKEESDIKDTESMSAISE